MAEDIRPIRWRDGALELLDQTLLPDEERWVRCETAEDVAGAIERLAVRGAPAIGIAAAYGLALTARRGDGGFEAAAELLGRTRPTAVNLRWAIERARERLAAAGPAGGAEALLELARELAAGQDAADRAIGAHGAALLGHGSDVMTHCNAGALATGAYGTAGGVIRTGYEQGRVAGVLVGETRPLLQGARLTAWELARLGIPHRLFADSAAGALMARGAVDAVVVGADRIAANGDTANKVGTYQLAVLARRHGIPFWIAAPMSTIDTGTATGSEIPIEERAAAELTTVRGAEVAPPGSVAVNPAFDVTPAELISGIVTEKGVLGPPYPDAIAATV